jgi:hypothetical protein
LKQFDTQRFQILILDQLFVDREFLSVASAISDHARPPVRTERCG